MPYNFEEYALWFENLSPSLPVLEAYQGTAVVEWQGRIERNIQQNIDKYAELNPDYATKLRTFLQIWRDNPLTGSLNIETVNVLKAATEVLAVDNWKMADYFSNLRDQLRKLVASAEQLPADPGKDGGMRRVPRVVSQPSMSGAPSSDFGPEREAPANLEPEEGEEETPMPGEDEEEEDENPAAGAEAAAEEEGVPA